MINIIFLDITVTSKRYPCFPVGNDGKSKLPSPHSGYPCVIGCGDNMEIPNIRNYSTPVENGGETPLKDFYNEIEVDASKANYSESPHTQSTELKGNTYDQN